MTRRIPIIAIGACAFALAAMSFSSAALAQPATVASGAYPEGLLWHSARMLFTEMGADRVSIIGSAGTREFWRESGCGPTSIAPFGPGFLVNCHLGRQVVEISAEAVAGRRFRNAPNGDPIQAPNASTSDGQGGVYFSDSGIFNTGAPATGRVYHLSASGKMTEVARDIRYANGVAFDTASRTLYVSAHLARRILALRLDASQRVTATRVFADFSNYPATREFSYPLAGPDGIALRPGLLAVAEYGEGRVHLFDRAGRHLNTLRVAMPFVDTVAWDDAGNLYAGGAFSNSQPPYEGRVVKFSPGEQEHWAGVLEHEAKSAFSHIRIRKLGQVRSMMFVRENGQEVLESRIDLGQPHALQDEYPRFLAANYLLRPQPKSVLIVGLGGGAMVHFLRHVDPGLRIDVVEIDPVVVRLADQYFNVRTGAGTTIITADGLKFLAETRNKYDVIYLDAFLKPSAATDATGAPLNLRARQFYKAVQTKLSPGGIVAFNLNRHAGDAEDLRNISAAFAQTYVFPLKGEYVVLASTDATRIAFADMEQRGRDLDRRLKAPGISFFEVSQFLQR
jgi:spermidine synthase